VILDVQMRVGWWQWQWQQNAGDDERGDSDGDGCHGPTGHGEGLCCSKELEAMPHNPTQRLKRGCEGGY